MFTLTGTLAEKDRQAVSKITISGHWESLAAKAIVNISGGILS